MVIRFAPIVGPFSVDPISYKICLKYEHNSNVIMWCNACDEYDDGYIVFHSIIYYIAKGRGTDREMECYL